ncbi:putative sodium/calcium exchanger 7 [Parelaphostrongylus tenuis]|uniref:Sodium/calcium exchanger 7 n=1 Tax=Parelaphostrongylus tenuis TaxID=148309 RepID=A0AAD5RD07_PARTN|nr:putative sodium/calcium exchanger 7 [Parelaphostrongylus tenuis]
MAAATLRCRYICDNDGKRYDHIRTTIQSRCLRDITRSRLLHCRIELDSIHLPLQQSSKRRQRKISILKGLNVVGSQPGSAPCVFYNTKDSLPTYETDQSSSAPASETHRGPISRKKRSNNDEGLSEDEFVVSHNHVFTGPEARSRAASVVPPPIEIVSLRMFIFDIYEHLRPLSDDWSKHGWFSKAIIIVKMPAMFVFKLTIPPNECSWSKAVLIIQAVVAPQWFLFAFKVTTVEPFNGSPALYAYALVLSLIMVVLLVFLTSMTAQPRYYKEVVSYFGFIMSLSWIYFISSEVVNVVTMFGVVSKLSHEILGLTILAWSNSIGDLIADISVVKQGYPRMAMVAAVGGPLFNLFIGFGVPFVIAIAKGKTVTINLNPTYKILLLFLGISLLSNLAAVLVQRFHLRRPHAYLLVFIYVCFILMIILTETNEVVWI